MSAETSVEIDDPTWEDDLAAEHIERLHVLVRQQHEEAHDGAFQWCPNELCQEVLRR